MSLIREVCQIQNAFAPDSVTINSDHLLVNCLNLKIQRVVRSIGFCPIVSSRQVHGQFAFTIVPYTMPEFFSSAVEIERPLNYFTVEDVANILRDQIYERSESDNRTDRWVAVNNSRRDVFDSLNQGIAEILSRYTNGLGPILEIGAGKGYKVPDCLSAKVIRTQFYPLDCYHLSQSNSNPIYQVNIEQIHQRLIQTKKKIPFFFALDVFDVFSATDRKLSLVQLSQLQNSGDHLLFMLDANPEIKSTIAQIEALYPEFVPMYYIPPGNGCTKAQVVLVPLENLTRKPSMEEFLASIKDSGKKAQEKQRWLHERQEEQNLTVIVLEDFFIKNMEKDLKAAGYDVDSYYHTSFTVGAIPEGLDIPSDLRFVYRPVTEVGNLRENGLTGKDVLDSLLKRRVQLPEYFKDDAFFLSMRANDQKIFISEILVIAAQKR